MELEAEVAVHSCRLLSLLHREGLATIMEEVSKAHSDNPDDMELVVSSSVPIDPPAPSTAAILSGR